jgi:hypothetical protein
MQGSHLFLAKLLVVRRCLATATLVLAALQVKLAMRRETAPGRENLDLANIRRRIFQARRRVAAVHVQAGHG